MILYMFKGIIGKKIKKRMIKMTIMAGNHRGKLQKTLMDFGEDEVKITKIPLIKKRFICT